MMTPDRPRSPRTQTSLPRGPQASGISAVCRLLPSATVLALAATVDKPCSVNRALVGAGRTRQRLGGNWLSPPSGACGQEVLGLRTAPQRQTSTMTKAGNPSTLEAELGGAELSSRPAWAMLPPPRSPKETHKSLAVCFPMSLNSVLLRLEALRSPGGAGLTD